MRGGGGYFPPEYPFDRLGELYELAGALPGGAVDLSVGTPCDPPPPAVVAALAGSGTERGYPTSAGSAELREAASDWMQRRLGVAVDPSAVAACVGTKEFVAGLPAFLHLRSPERDTVLCPAVAYPTYAMGAALAGLRAVEVAPDAGGRLDLSSIEPEDASRALCLWVNTPGNPAGQIEDLAAVAEWGRSHGVPVFSDECYVELTWQGPRQTILRHGHEGLVAVHSLSKRSNMAGLRVGFYAGDADLVGYLASLRRHAGFMVPGPVQHAAAVALGDDDHVEAQRGLYCERLAYLAGALEAAGFPAKGPEGGFYLFVAAPELAVSPVGANGEEESPSFSFARLLALKAGAIVSPGDAYGPRAAAFVRIAAVQPLERLRVAGDRLAKARLGP